MPPIAKQVTQKDDLPAPVTCGIKLVAMEARHRKVQDLEFRRELASDLTEY